MSESVHVNCVIDVVGGAPDSNSLEQKLGEKALSQLAPALSDIAQTLGELAVNQATVESRFDDMEERMSAILEAVTAKHDRAFEAEVARRMRLEEEVEELKSTIIALQQSKSAAVAPRQEVATQSKQQAVAEPTAVASEFRRQATPDTMDLNSPPMDPRWFSKVQSTAMRPPDGTDDGISPRHMAELQIGGDRAAQERRTRARQEAAEREKAKADSIAYARRQEEIRHQQEKLSVIFDDDDVTDDLFAHSAVASVAAKPAPKGLFDDEDA